MGERKEAVDSKSRDYPGPGLYSPKNNAHGPSFKIGEEKRRNPPRIDVEIAGAEMANNQFTSLKYSFGDKPGSYLNNKPQMSREPGPGDIVLPDNQF